MFFLPRAVQAFFISLGVVALGEVGDKTQLLALMLAARWRRPLPIIAGILVATLLNHSLAGVLGAAVAHTLGPQLLRWVIGLGFLLMAGWMLVPDKAEDVSTSRGHFGVFGSTLLAFFLAEMGDKTQIATVALAARFNDLFAVVAGTTLGMLVADVPAVLLGERAAHALPMQLVHAISAAVFALLGVLTLLDVGHFF